MARTPARWRLCSVFPTPILREGAAIKGTFQIRSYRSFGTEDERGPPVMRETLPPLFLNETPILFTDRRTSELIKSMRRTPSWRSRSPFNQTRWQTCAIEGGGANVAGKSSRGIGLDNRIGRIIPECRTGLWRSWLPEDTLAAYQTANDAGAPVRIIDTVVEVMQRARKPWLPRSFARWAATYGQDGSVCWDSPFKHNTTTFARRAEPRYLARPLIQAGARSAPMTRSMTEASHLLDGVGIRHRPV